MNWLDSAIGWLSPNAGLRRVQARHAMDMVRSYEAARRDRRTENWRTRGSSADAEVTPSLARVRNRARDLVRNNPHANKALAILAAKKIGTGIVGRPDAGARAAWDEFVENCDHEGDLDFNGIQFLATRCADEAGSALLRRIWVRGGRVPIRIQLLEPDYIDANKFGPTNNGNYVIAGIEIDSSGRRQAYWLFDQHPGDNFVSSAFGRGMESKRVPATEIIQLYEKLRPGQLHGISRLAASIMRARDLDEFQEAELVRKKIEACFVAFVRGGSGSRTLAEPTTDTTTGQRTETLAPGMIEYLAQGEEVDFGSPSGVTGVEYTSDQLHAIAAGCGVTYEQMTGDLSGVNFSSIRAGQQDFRDMVDAWRWIYCIPMALRRVWGWVLEAGYLEGGLKSQRYEMVWTPPRWPYVNPVDDVKADVEEAKAGFASRRSKVLARGEDPKAVYDEIKDEREEANKDGLKFSTDAASAAKPAADDDKDDKPTEAVVPQQQPKAA